jgi:TetR/AcrR family transcriptional regulator, repressor for uid operon
MRTRNKSLNDQREAGILDAAAACFVQKGFHSTSMKDICVAAGLSPGTVYHYVRSKTDIIQGIIERERALTAALLRPLVDAEDFFIVLDAALDALAAGLTQDGLVLSAEIAAEILRQPDLAAFSRAAEKETAAGLSAAIARGQARGPIDPSLDPTQAAAMVLALIDGLLWQATLGGVDSLAALLPGARQAIARMLIAPDGSR